MDYEKAYKKALERAKEVIKNNPDFVRVTPKLMEEIFPELEESDGERVRKNLIELFHDTVSNDEIFSDYGLDKTEVLAWLEKQGKKSSIRERYDRIKESEWFKKTHEGMSISEEVDNANKVEPKDYSSIDPHFGKPNDKVEPKFKAGDVMRTLQEAADGFIDGMPVVVSIDEEYYHCNNELIAIKDQDSYEYPPINRRQKTAWSEEDEKNLQRLTDEIEANKHSLSDYELEAYDRFLDWLKSLKDRLK